MVPGRDSLWIWPAGRSCWDAEAVAVTSVAAANWKFRPLIEADFRYAFAELGSRSNIFKDSKFNVFSKIMKTFHLKHKIREDYLLQAIRNLHLLDRQHSVS